MASGWKSTDWIRDKSITHVVFGLFSTAQSQSLPVIITIFLFLFYYIDY